METARLPALSRRIAATALAPARFVINKDSFRWRELANPVAVLVAL